MVLPQSDFENRIYLYPQISVIVPIYNVDKFLDDCIESIVNQTYQNIEIILVDDGSTDESSIICDRWAQKDSRIIAIHQKNTGPSIARKNGIARSKGRYLYFVDGDDYIDPELCATLLECSINNDADIVVFDANNVSEKGVFISNIELLNEQILKSNEALEELIKGNIKDYFWNKFCKRELFENLDFLDVMLCEDKGVMYKLFIKAERIYFLPKRLYNYRVRTGSITNSVSDRQLQDLFKVLHTRYYDLINDYPNIAEMSFLDVAITAIRLYDRSIWGDVNENLLKRALVLLNDNKEKILNSNKKRRFILFYKSRKIYNIIRLIRHNFDKIKNK